MSELSAHVSDLIHNGLATVPPTYGSNTTTQRLALNLRNLNIQSLLVTASFLLVLSFLWKFISSQRILTKGPWGYPILGVLVVQNTNGFQQLILDRLLSNAYTLSRAHLAQMSGEIRVFVFYSPR